LTAKAGTVTVAKNVSFGNRTSDIPTGTVNAVGVKIASFVITAGGGEAVDITQITLQDADGTSQVGDNFQNLMIKHGDTQLGNTVSNPDTTGTQATYDFDVNPAARVDAGGQYVVDVYADIKSNPQDSSKELLPVIRVDAVAATGVDTSQDASATTGQNLALQQAYISTAGTLRVAVDPDTQIGMPLVMGAADQGIAKFKFDAGPQEAIEITDLTIHNNTTGNGTAYNLALYNGDTLVAGPVQFAATAATSSTYYAATFTGLTLTIPASQSLILTAKVDLATYDSGGTSGSTHSLGFLYNLGTDTITARGASSGSTITGASLIYAVSGTADSDQMGQTFVVYRTLVLAAWASDTPNGASSAATGQLIAKVNLTNTANAGNYAATIYSINLALSATGFTSATTQRNLKIYKDSLATTPLATTYFGGDSAINPQDTSFPQLTSFTNQQIGANSTKTFFVTLDTNDAATNANLSVYVDSTDIYWGDGSGASGITYAIATLPLQSKTFTY
jgi:hypothetical protein